MAQHSVAFAPGTGDENIGHAAGTQGALMSEEMEEKYGVRPSSLFVTHLALSSTQNIPLISQLSSMRTSPAGIPNAVFQPEIPGV